MTRSLVGEAAVVVVGSEAEAAFTEAAGGVPCMRDVTTVAATGAASVRHIPSRVAPGVPDIQLLVGPVVR